MRIKNKKTGQTTVITQEGYDNIIEQGWKNKFEIVDENETIPESVNVIAIPKSVSAELKEKSINFEIDEVKSKLALFNNNEEREEFVKDDTRSRVGKLMKKYRNNQ